ncbi:hypothetical protein [Paraburkholderia rhynchosiae]|uniref:hypothetical protein n=1 Tax=Paraburkholderia rhynchosiae TaxID=487049 RepID=UPI001FCA200A|nr:hypothetical protein [Paraburkholderia rhynchosiae]
MQIDQQKQRRAFDPGQVRDGVVNAANGDVRVRHRLFEHEALQSLFGIAVSDKRHEVRGSYAGLF